REQGILTLWLEVRESNLAAQKLYDSLGFNEVTIRKNYYPTPSGERENAIVMALYL
ncbi:ribosomal-protein-alanine N-acetyltransferase, partial [Xanthomonas citri pv. citri]|nr:ribosomal-protein-alanine N-acetyltransferase [Xanthomonas citri pv. citri]